MSVAAPQDLDLAVIGNCEVAALVDRFARIVWLCMPRPDGDPVFSALLSRDQGSAQRGVFAVDLENVVESEQHYVRNTAVVETTLRDSSGGAIRIVDFAPRFRSRGRMFRPKMIVRRIEPLAGRPLLRVRLRPTTLYGTHEPALRSGSHHLRFDVPGGAVRVTCNGSLNAICEERSFVLSHPLVFVLGPDEPIEHPLESLALGFLEETRAYWQDWVRTLAIPFDWQEAVIRAAITLKLCTYEDSGAVLAALTTSVPESPESGRNWDYRYCWMRDSFFVVQALNRLGATRTMEGYLHYIDQVVSASGIDALQPLYGITGDIDLAESVQVGLEGFRGMGPVRVGNQAASQVQHDVYGAIILAATQLFFDERLVHPGDLSLFRRLELIGARAVEVYDRPDAGPWEFRGIARVHTFSATVSWAGCDRLARIAHRLGLRDEHRHWRETAERMRGRILERAWSDQRRAFTGSFGGTELDASLLLLPELGLLDATDPRFLQTLNLIGRELREGDLVFRYRHPDDFGAPASAFMVCGFWFVNALVATGQRDAACEHFEQLLRRRNSLGLLSEDVDPRTGALWGNYPQTYSLVGIINSALRLSRSWEAAL